MTCTALLRFAALVAAGLSVPLASRGQPPAPYRVGRDLPAFEAPPSAAAPLPDVHGTPSDLLRLEDSLAALLRNPERAADTLLETWALHHTLDSAPGLIGLLP